MTYTITAAADGEKCHDCGEPATVALVADYVEHETGYLDTVVLCESCFQMNYANKLENNHE